MTDRIESHFGTNIRSVIAPNPSMMTHNGTNTYILGSGDVAVIDPGPAIASHQAAICAALKPGERISHIFVTHAHLDHSALAPSLAKITGAPVFAFGTAVSGRSPIMQRLVPLMTTGGGEGVDQDFQPDVILMDGDRIDAASWSLEAIHTPGHMGNHLCFAMGATLFSGDHVMGWSTSLISPPDGDMTDYMAALAKLQARDWGMFLPGHGPALINPAHRLAELIAHRQARASALLAALRAGELNIPSLTRAVYQNLAEPLIPAARRNVLAHLIDLERQNKVRGTPHPGPEAIFALV